MFSRKEFFARRRRGAGSGLSLASLPGVCLEQISPLGLVFSAGLPSEPGTSLALGIHLSKAGVLSQFLQVQASVVDCRPLEEGVRSGRYRITLLFHGLSKRQSAVLSNVSAASADSVSPWSSFVPPPFPGGVSFSGFDGYPPVCGLN